MPVMRETKIGSGTRVSALCLGTLPFGSTVDEETSFAILDRFTEAGGTFLDTANNYVFWNGTGDESEELLGRWLAARGNRDQVVLATKMGGRPRVPGTGLENAEGLSAPVIKAAAEGSLRRLGVDHIDLYYSHIEDRSVPMEETLGAFAELVHAGTVGTLGCSNHATWRMALARAVSRANGWPLYTCVQERHSYLRPRPDIQLPAAGHVQMTDELFDYARAEGDITLLAYSALLSGAYRDKPLPEYYDHPGTTRRLAVLNEVAGELGATVNQVVLAWLLAGDLPILPVLGVSTVDQLDEALAGMRLKLDEDQLTRLDSAS
jgi:aryl-alcohol dehydrogenase-like predicted oxidoreductase